jgi:hypothetical protein
MMKEEGEVYHSYCSIKILSNHIPKENEKAAYCLIVESGDLQVQVKCCIAELASEINGAVTKIFQFHPQTYYQNKYKVCVQF